MRYRISYVMDEIWERAVETALDGQTDHATVRNLTLDGAVKCVHGRLPPPSIFEKFQNLLHLSIANIGVSTLEQFPRLTNLQKLVLSDNRISTGLEFLVDAGLESLRDLDLSNNRIQLIEDLAPLAQLRIVSLDLYECPVTRVKDYRSRVFGLIKSLRYLDKMDAEGIERLESDDEEEEDEEEDEEDDPGSGEIDGEDHPIVNGHAGEHDEVVDVGEDEESYADEEETEISRNGLDSNHQVNGFHVIDVQDEDGDEDDVEYEVDNESGEEEIDEEDGDDEAVVEVHEIDDSEEDVVAEDEDGDDSEEEEVDNEDGDFAEPESTGRLMSTEGEIDGHEQGEDDAEEDDNGETGEEELALDDEEEEVEEEGEEDFDGGYLVQPVVHAEEDADGSDMDPGNEEDDLEEDLDEEDDLVEDEDDDPLGAIELQAPSSSHLKRKRGENVSDDDIDIDGEDDSDSDSGSDEDGNDDDDGGKEDGEDDDDVL